MKRALWAIGFLVFVAFAARGQDVVPTGIQVDGVLSPLKGVDLQGKPVGVPRLQGQRALVLSFWSIHCGDCIRELDDLRSIRKDFPAEEVALVAVNTDSGIPVARVEAFVKRYEAARGEPLNVLHLLDRDAAILNTLGIRYIPLLIVADRTGRVTSIVTGYSPDDRSQVAKAWEQGSVALGAWNDQLRAKLRTLLRAPGPGGETIEWGSFRVEEGMALFGLYDASGWLADVAGRRKREFEVQRVEEVVKGRLRASLFREALAGVGAPFPAPDSTPFQYRGTQVPESALDGPGPWRRLYEDLGFERLYREQWKNAIWVGDEHWAGLVADVDLGGLRRGLDALGFPRNPSEIRLGVVSDFDYKSRIVFQTLQRTSYRLQRAEGQNLSYFGTSDRLAEELRTLSFPDFRIFVEVLSPGAVRVEVY